MIVCLSYKRKPWIVRYREPWSGKPRQKAFATEQEAQDFEMAQLTVLPARKKSSAPCDAVNAKNNRTPFLWLTCWGAIWTAWAIPVRV